MIRIAQFGIALSALGAVVTFMGLFPGVMGIDPAAGIGTVQIFIVLVGFTLMILGALIYVKYAFYPDKPHNLAQQIGVRLALTGLVFAAMAGLTDVLGFGSHLETQGEETFFGTWQAVGVVGSFVLSSVGVIIYAASGDVGDDGDDGDASANV